MGDKTSHRRRARRIRAKIMRDPMARALEDPAFRQQCKPGKKDYQRHGGQFVNHESDNDSNTTLNWTNVGSTNSK